MSHCTEQLNLEDYQRDLAKPRGMEVTRPCNLCPGHSFSTRLDLVTVLEFPFARPANTDRFVERRVMSEAQRQFCFRK